jgi:hypothetical protein
MPARLDIDRQSTRFTPFRGRSASSIFCCGLLRVDSGQCKQIRAESVRVAHRVFDRRLRLLPERHRRRQSGAPRRRKDEPAAPFVGIVDRHPNQPAAFKRFEIGGERGAIHRQQRGSLAEARRFRALGRRVRELSGVAAIASRKPDQGFALAWLPALMALSRRSPSPNPAEPEPKGMV